MIYELHKDHKISYAVINPLADPWGQRSSLVRIIKLVRPQWIRRTD